MLNKQEVLIAYKQKGLLVRPQISQIFIFFHELFHHKKIGLHFVEPLVFYYAAKHGKVIFYFTGLG